MINILSSSRRRADNDSPASSRAGSRAGMMRMYTDDTPGIKVYKYLVIF